MVFESRQDAGRKLGLRLQHLAIEVDLVAGLPRGGVVVAAEVADVLQRPLEVVVVRKVGHPWHREFAVGALAEHGVLILDREAILAAPVSGPELEAVVEEERERLRDYCSRFCMARSNNFAGSRVLLVDDGLATGASAEAAVYSAREKKAREIILAAPVASASAVQRLARVADKVVSLVTDRDFAAVGQYYRHFLPTSDEEVLALLHRQHADYGQAK
jgi:predicted phosphoribosyltransferase